MCLSVWNYFTIAPRGNETVAKRRKRWRLLEVRNLKVSWIQRCTRTKTTAVSNLERCYLLLNYTWGGAVCLSVLNCVMIAPRGDETIATRSGLVAVTRHACRFMIAGVARCAYRCGITLRSPRGAMKLSRNVENDGAYWRCEI